MKKKFYYLGARLSVYKFRRKIFHRFLFSNGNVNSSIFQRETSETKFDLAV